MSKHLNKLALAAALLATAPAMAATITTYTDKAAWEAAVGSGYTTEDFADATLAPNLSIAGTGAYSISGGRLNDLLLPGRTGTAFNFGSAISAFGGNFDLSPGGAGTGIRFTLLGGGILNYVLPTELPAEYTGQFFGFVSDEGFLTVQLATGSNPNGAAETYNADNLVFADTLGAEVPEPASLALLGLGMAGFAAARRRKG